MKKNEYVAPELEIVEIKTCQPLLIGSETLGGDKDNDGDLEGWD